MEDTKPHPLTSAEWKEIMTVRGVREAWGIDDDETVDQFSAMVYAVKFNFVSGSPGYLGDLFILHGDDVGVAPMILRRDDKGSLIVV
jgi:hypothetical protein